MNDLDIVGERIGTALTTIADRYTPSFTLDDIVSAADRPPAGVEIEVTKHRAGPGRTHTLRYVAAAMVIAAGAAAVYALGANDDQSARPNTVSSVDTVPSAPNPNISDDIDLTPPDEVAVLEPAPGGEEPLRDNPYVAWLYVAPSLQKERWFARFGDDDLPSAAMSISDGPDSFGWLRNWEDRSVDGELLRDLPGNAGVDRAQPRRPRIGRIRGIGKLPARRRGHA